MRPTVLAAGVVWLLATASVAEAQTSPKKTKDVAPLYPRASLEKGDEASILFELRVAPDGTVESARLLRSSCPRLNDAALVAARQWVFEPMIVSGRAIAYSITATVPFRLGNRKPAKPAADACKWSESRPLT